MIHHGKTLRHKPSHDPLFANLDGPADFGYLSHGRLNCARFQSGSDYPAAFTALRLLYIPPAFLASGKMVPMAGLEPTTSGFVDRRSDPDELHRQILVWVEGFEPPAFRSQGGSSTQAELHPDILWWASPVTIRASRLFRPMISPDYPDAQMEIVCLAANL